MAEVLKAKDTSRPGGPIVAVKRILPHLTDDRQYVTMFLDESRVLAQLEHDNIIHTLEVGQVGETPFIALEYVWGQDARMLFHRARRDEQPIPIRLSCYIVAQACAALHHAHEHKDADGNLLGLVHRDVSLQNILCSYDGEVKLTDFGIAMSAQNKARTEAGIVKGKFGYMSPEQIKGEPMDRRSDVFAAGICLYELLASERLFSGETDYAAVEKVRNVVIEPPSRWNREIPSALEAIVMKALSKHPRDRFQNAADLRRALLAFMAESHNECSAKDLAQHMRHAFAEELAKHPTPDALRREGRPRSDELTGLAAFDNLDPISALSGPSAAHPSPQQGYASEESPRGGAADAPSVPPVIPRRDSVPMGHGQSDVFARPELPSSIRSIGSSGGAEEMISLQGAAPVDLDWDEDDLATGADPGAELQSLPEPPDDDIGADDDVTRQLYVGETFSGVSVAGSGAPTPGLVATPFGAPSPFDAARPATVSDPTPSSHREELGPSTFRPMQQTSYGIVVGIVIGIVATIAGALYLTRGAVPAEVHLATVPVDAQVRVDGKLRSGERSPFVISDLGPGTQHRIEVGKTGYHSWSSNFALASGQVLELPLVTLEPEPGLAQPTTGVAEAAPAAEAATAAPGSSPVVQEVGEVAIASRPQERSAETRSGAAVSHVARPRRSEAAQPSSGSRPAFARAPVVSGAGGGARKATPIPGRAAPSAAEGAAATGVLRINSRPWAELTIDGKPAGNTPQMNLRLPAGTHSVRLSNPQFGLKKTLKIQLAAGQTVTKIVDLQ